MRTLVKWLKENVSRKLRSQREQRKMEAEERKDAHPNDFFQDPAERINEKL